MDRRQQKTRAAIFTAFTTLLTQKSYSKITVQDIIDTADVGRTTFYAHFETKEDLLKALCEALFQHIMDSAKDCTHTHGLYTNDQPESIFCHLLQHLQENDHHILELLTCDQSGIFLRYFQDSLSALIESHYIEPSDQFVVPRDFLIHHISGSFVEMVLWWMKGHQKYTPVELDQYFRCVIAPILSKLS